MLLMLTMRKVGTGIEKKEKKYLLERHTRKLLYLDKQALVRHYRSVWLRS